MALFDAPRAGFAAFAASALLSACGGPASFARPPAPFAEDGRSKTASPIRHVVLVVQENRTFNDFFATYPGADGTTTGRIAKISNPRCHVGASGTIALTKVPLVTTHDLDHRYVGYRTARDGGKMDAFDKIPSYSGNPECFLPYVYTDPAQIQPYWDMAEQYTLAEHMFPTHGSSSFVAHQDLIRGSTDIGGDVSLIDFPTGEPWGCDAKAGTVTSLITSDLKYLLNQGPFPCTNAFPSSGVGYRTMRDLLDQGGVSWKYYAPPFDTNFGKLLTAFDVIAPVRYGPEWNTNVVTPQTKIFHDVSARTLPAVSWVIPDEPESDHPGEKVDRGPAWVASIVNAVGESPYWDSTAIVVLWDDWGGLYDNANPPQLGYGGLGFRVPAIVISPYAKAGYISKTSYEFGSILRYIEENFALGSLGTSDKRAHSIGDCFDYSQAPIAFTPIPSQYSKEFFIRERPSYRANDTDY